MPGKIMSTTTKQTTNWFSAGVLILFATYITKLSRDMILPSLPAMAETFNASASTIQLNVSIYFFGIAISRLVWPSLSDIISRRNILILCLLLFTASTALTSQSSSALLFLFGRFIQAVSIAGIPLITRAQIFGDNGSKKSIQLFAGASLLSAWAPAVATALGGLIQAHYGWQMQFHFLLFLALLGLLLYLFMLQSDAKRHRKPIQSLWPAYTTIIRNLNFWKIALPFSLLTAMLAVYYTISPFLLMNHYGMSAQHYGFLTIFMIAGMTFGMFFSGVLSTRINIKNIVRIGTSISFLASLFLVTLFFYTTVQINMIIGSISIFAFGMGLLNPTVKTQVMTLHSSHAGTVLAVLGMVEALISTLSAALAAQCAIVSALPLALFLVGLSGLSLLIIAFE